MAALIICPTDLQSYLPGKGTSVGVDFGTLCYSIIYSIGDIVNRFRERTLGLSPLSIRSGAGVIERLKIPWTYCMSSALVPKPDDWQNHIGELGCLISNS
jgi:hypothetical protein